MMPPLAFGRRGGVLALIVGLLLAGVAVAILRRPVSTELTPTAPPSEGGSTLDHGSHDPTTGAATIPQEGMVMLTPEMVRRAGIRTEAAVSGSAAQRLRVPGVVQPNGYREVAVTSLVAGRVTQVRVQLGDQVRRGAVVVALYSPELADAQTEYVAMHAELLAHDRQLERTQRLASIGAASRQELEMVEAGHARLEASVEALLSRLRLFGVSEERLKVLPADHKVSADAEVRAPIDGVVTTREANPGLNVTPATPLLTLVDLSTVWVIADVYERDFGTVRLGTPVRITSAAYPGLELEGAVSYIDPQMREATRTARARIEVTNPGGRLRLGSYVDVEVHGAEGGDGVLIPAGALQTVGARRVVYVADEARPGHYVEREVEVGPMMGERALVTRGLSVNERVVTDGAFFVRSERERAAPGAGAVHQH